LLRQKLLIVSLLQEKKFFGEKEIAAIMRFLNNYVHFKKPENNRILVKKQIREQVKQILWVF